MSIDGCATAEGTARYRKRFPNSAPHHFRIKQNITLSSVGIGTYLGNADEATDKNYSDSVIRSVQLGSNVIDSAANYRFQRSERSIGHALAWLMRDGKFDRSELVICTKGGYLPFNGTQPRDLRGYVESTFVQPGIASFDDFVGGVHCMTPAYLQNQLEQSLQNMGIDSVDIYYIHNPESQLGYISENEFYYRLRLAFEHLEENRAHGKLQWYGVATWNGFRVPMQSQEYHSLSRMVDAAREVGGESHGFRFVQLPFNLAMPEALTLMNQKVDNRDLTMLEAAKQLDITVIASASMLQGRVARGLPETVRAPLGSLATDAQTAVQFVRSTPGMTTALVGMSRVEHVEENLKLVNIEPAGSDEFAQLFS
jgi:aryl-alcohol dehydrogenase-like predicted oxidoreductase